MGVAFKQAFNRRRVPENWQLKSAACKLLLAKVQQQQIEAAGKLFHSIAIQLCQAYVSSDLRLCDFNKSSILLSGHFYLF